MQQTLQSTPPIAQPPPLGHGVCCIGSYASDLVYPYFIYPPNAFWLLECRVHPPKKSYGSLVTFPTEDFDWEVSLYTVPSK